MIGGGGSRDPSTHSDWPAGGGHQQAQCDGHPPRAEHGDGEEAGGARLHRLQVSTVQYSTVQAGGYHHCYLHCLYTGFIIFTIHLFIINILLNMNTLAILRTDKCNPKVNYIINLFS